MIGSNRYRYYLPEQSLELTRIIFASKAKVPLKDIASSLSVTDPSKSMTLYNQISQNLSMHIRELEAVQDTIRNMKYYYSLTLSHELNQPFTLYLPEWFLIHSQRLKISARYEATESNIANHLFMKGFRDGLWPHYQLGAFFSEEEFLQDQFSETSYFLKTDHPEAYSKEDLLFIPNGRWVCVILNVQGQNLPDAMKQYKQTLYSHNLNIHGHVFVMDIINSMLTTDVNQYRTMIFSLEGSKHHE